MSQNTQNLAEFGFRELDMAGDLLKIAIFNPGRNWDVMAWAVVQDNEEAHDIGVANGFHSWKLESLDEYQGSVFCNQVRRLLTEYNYENSSL